MKRSPPFLNGPNNLKKKKVENLPYLSKYKDCIYEFDNKEDKDTSAFKSVRIYLEKMKGNEFELMYMSVVNMSKQEILKSIPDVSNTKIKNYISNLQKPEQQHSCKIVKSIAEKLNGFLTSKSFISPWYERMGILILVKVHDEKIIYSRAVSVCIFTHKHSGRYYIDSVANIPWTQSSEKEERKKGKKRRRRKRRQTKY